MVTYFHLNSSAGIDELCTSIRHSLSPREAGYCIVRNDLLSPNDFMELINLRVAASFTISHIKGHRLVYDHVKDQGIDMTESTYPLLSATNTIFPLHTDNCYMQTPADVVVLYCVENAANGGDSTLVNINSIVHLLPVDYKEFLLCRKYYIDTMPYTVLRQVDGIYHIRYQAGDMLAYAPLHDKEKMEEELKPLADLLSDPAHFITIKLKANECLIINNHTCLHGRYGFEKGGNRDFLRSRSYLISETTEV